MTSTVPPQIQMRRFASRAELDRRARRALIARGHRALERDHALGWHDARTRLCVGGRARRARRAGFTRAVFRRALRARRLRMRVTIHLSQPLFAALALPAEQVLRVRTELPLAKRDTQDYEERLRSLLDAKIRIRLGLLGLGADGHTASLFTSANLEAARQHLAISVQRPDGRSAVSVTPDFLAQVEEILFVVAGADKTPALKRLNARDPTLTAWRAVEHCAEVHVWTDAEAWPP